MEQLLNHGGNIYRAARESSRKALDFCDFSASINPLGIPPSVKRILRNAAPQIQHYPDPEGWALRAAIAKRHRVSARNVLLGNGTTELIYAIPPGRNIRHALIIGPTFSEYVHALELANSQVTILNARSQNNFHPPIIEAVKMVKKPRPVSGVSRTRQIPIDAVFFCNPNSPTGQCVSRKVVYRTLNEVKQTGGLLIVDETFVDFCEEKSVVCRAARDDSLLVLRSFTKFYGIPGLRVGYAIGTEKTLKPLQARLPPWSVNTLAQEAALACVSDNGFKEKSLSFFQKERQRFHQALQEIPGCRVYPSFANFFLIELPRPLTSRQVSVVLREQGILVRDCSNYPGLNKRNIRLAVRTSKENSRLVNRLMRLVNAKK